MKKCFKCGEYMPLSEFYRHPAMADGHLNKCKTCTKRDVHEHRHGKGRQTVLVYDRARASTPHRASARARIVAAWGRLHPDRRNAQLKLRRAVKAGRVVPWPVCEVPDCSDKPEAHHPDYSRPLMVCWLCSAHHKQAHALIKKADQP